MITLIFPVDELFKAISDCGSLHPDPQSEGSDVVDMDDAYVDPEIEVTPQLDGEEPDLTEAGRVRSDFMNDNRYRPY